MPAIYILAASMEEEVHEAVGSSAAVAPLLVESRQQYYWPSGAGDFGGEELMMSELFDEAEGASMVNKLVSTVYSGPTISDIESALSFTGSGGDHGHQQLAVAAVDDDADPHPPRNKFSSSAAGPPPAVVFSPEKVLSKMENKYTLKMKTCGNNNGLAEDGYKWRKYGQKSIKNSPNPRSYYRCTNPRCNAKKQVERSTQEADTLLVTYEGLHLHYTYSHFLHSQATKKPKLHPRVAGQAQEDISSSSPLPPAASSSAYLVYDHDCSSNSFFFQRQQQQADDEGDYTTVTGIQQPPTTTDGLLEDVVRPLLARRRPCSRSSTSTSSSSGGATSPPPPQSISATSSSVSWNPASRYIDMAILSNIF